MLFCSVIEGLIWVVLKVGFSVVVIVDKRSMRGIFSRMIGLVGVIWKRSVLSDCVSLSEVVILIVMFVVMRSMICFFI